MFTATQLIDAAQVPIRPWPADGLERVENCPVCSSSLRHRLYEGLRDRVYHYAPGEWTLYRCLVCGSGYLDPRPTRQTIGRAYQNYFTHDSPSDNKTATRIGLVQSIRQSLRNGYLNHRYNTHLMPTHVLGRILVPVFTPLRHRADRWVRHLPRPFQDYQLLEIGCGNGSFLTTMRESGWTVRGLEPDPEAAIVARQSGLSVTQAVLEESTFPDETFDAITLHHVVEHLHDPADTLRICHKILRPGGLISVITPNLKSRGSVIFKRNWYPLHPPFHLVLFTGNSLRGVLERAGFQESFLHPSSFVAESTFSASAKLAAEAGATPQEAWQWRVQSKIANMMVYIRSDWSEEVVMTARKSV